MAMSKVVKTLKLVNKLKYYYDKGINDIFIEKDNVSVHFGGGKAKIIDLANAMWTNKDCRTFTFSEHEFEGFGDMPFSKFISACRAGEYKFAESTMPGAEVFSPFKGAAGQNLLKKI